MRFGSLVGVTSLNAPEPRLGAWVGAEQRAEPTQDFCHEMLKAFDEWTGVFASERLTGALLDRLTHHVHILEMNGDSYRLKQSKRRTRDAVAETHPAEIQGA